MKLFKYILSFLLLSLLLIFMIEYLKQKRINDILIAKDHLLVAEFNTIIHGARQKASILYQEVVNTPKIISLFERAHKATTSDQRDALRYQLYEALLPTYERMHKYNLKQLHFHFQNNDSFLRFHRPQKYGDNLTDIRSTVAYVNRVHKPIVGFEEGRIFNGYRFVFPVFQHHEYIGSVETSISMAAIINEMEMAFLNHTDFIIKKEVVDQKVFKEEQTNYKVCSFDPNFYSELSIVKQRDKSHLAFSNIVSNTKDILKKLETSKLFTVYGQYHSRYYTVTFLPIENAFSHQVVAYLVSSAESPELEQIITEALMYEVIAVFIVFLLLLFMYRTFESLQKEKNLKEAIKRSELLFKKAEEIAHIGHWELEYKTMKLYWSDQMYRIYDIEPFSIEPTQEFVYERMHPEDLEKSKKEFNTSIEHKTNYTCEHRIVGANNNIKYLLENSHHIYLQNGSIKRTIGTALDITELKEKEMQLKKALKRVQELHQQTQKVLDVQKNIVLISDGVELKYVNKEFLEFFGVKDLDTYLQKRHCICDEFINHEDYFGSDEAKSNSNWIESISVLNENKRIVSMLDKTLIPHAMYVSINRFDLDYIVTFTDISVMAVDQMKLRYKVSHDALTKAFSRDYFYDNIELLSKEIYNSDRKLALIMIDIDYFKQINDNFGHDIGDEVLIHLTTLIKHLIRKEDKLIRWGGEEFFLLVSVNNVEEAVEIAQKVRHAIEVEHFETIEHITCSFGVSLLHPNEDTEHWIKRADDALYVSKESGRNRVNYA